MTSTAADHAPARPARRTPARRTPARRTPARRTPARRTIATVCLSGLLDDKLAAAAAAGFDGVELFEDDLIASAPSPERIR